MTSSNQICKMLRKRKPFNLHTVDSRWTKLVVFSNTGLKKLLNHSELLFSFLFSFHRMAPNGTVSHEILRTRKCPLDYLGVRNISSFFVSPTDEAEVTSIISQMQTGKSVGPFSIPLNLLKMLKSAIAPSLAVLINESFLYWYFPDKLKIAKVTAIHKKGSTDNPSNYRPI